MLTQWIRTVLNSNDVSIANSRESETIPFDNSPVFYIGKRLAFNNFYFWFEILNAAVSKPAVSYWNGTTWVNAVDILDGTNDMTRSGVIQFSPLREERWVIAGDSSLMSGSGLENLTIYNMFWLKIEFSNPLDVGTELKQASYKFTNSEELKDFDIDIDTFLPAFGQTDWDNQILKASIMVGNDFIKRGVIKDAGQLLRFDDTTLLTAYKTLFLIYLSLGDSYKERRDEIQSLYIDAFKGIFTIDKDGDGFEDPDEIGGTSGKIEAKPMVRR